MKFLVVTGGNSEVHYEKNKNYLLSDDEVRLVAIKDKQFIRMLTFEGKIPKPIPSARHVNTQVVTVY